LLITGASGLGKSWLACALGHKACRENMSVLYTRMPRLFADLAIAHGDARYARLLRSLARVKLLILDDWGPEALTPDQARDLLEIVEDRYDKGSLIITSQVPVDRWHDLIGVPKMTTALARPPHPSLRHRRDRQRKLALQEPRLILQTTAPR
jgi:DNA replication protein DnaC